MENFTALQERLQGMKKELIESNFEYSKVREYTKDFKKLFEFLIFDLNTSTDDYFGIVLVNLGRKFNYTISSPMTHQIINMNVVVHINPLLFIDYSKEDMKEIIKHEVYHIIGQHAKRTEIFVDTVPSKIIALACDLVACHAMNISSTKLWFTYSSLKEKYDIELDRNNTIEENIKELMVYYDENEEFARMITDSYYEDWYDEDFFDIEEEKLSELVFIVDCDNESLTMFPVFASDRTDMKLLDDFIRNISVEASSNSRGLLPAGFKQLMDALTEPPKIAWQKVLCKRLGSLPVPYKKTIVRNSRRMPERLDVRGRISDRIAKLFVAIDTSASVSDSEINYVLNEIRAISKVYKAEVTVVEADAEVQRVYKLDSSKGGKVKSDIEGRGGTCFSPTIEYLTTKENMDKTSVLIYFTDGEGETEVPKVNCPIIWVLTRDSELSVMNPQGRVLRLQDDAKYKKTFK